MTDYTKATNFATKDSLSPGSALKIVRGTEIDTEFNAIATAIATKTDNAAAAITGGTITGITDLAVADGGTGASNASGARTNLGLVIGTNVQAWDADLDTWAGKTAPSGTVVGTTDTQTLSNKTISGNLNMTSGTKYQVSGVATNALAWVNFNGTPSTPTIRSAYNVGSITKNSTGSFTVNFTTTLTDANYSVQTMTGDFLSGLNTYNKVGGTNGLYTTSSVSVTCWYQPTTAYKDPEYGFVAIFGN